MKANCKINHYIDNFRQILIDLGCELEDNNIVLAGVNALKLHGLYMSREANDLDVVIFKPTQKQLDYLSCMSFFQQALPDGRSGDYETEFQKVRLKEGHQRVVKFKKNDLFIDIILSDNELPSDLLYYKAFSMMFKIQNIALNIEAKNSYKLESQRDGFQLYRRAKDMEDMIDLKNSNFNF